jgi:hypothetical protein
MLRLALTDAAGGDASDAQGRTRWDHPLSLSCYPAPAQSPSRLC